MTRKYNENMIKKIKMAMLESGFNQTSLAKKSGVKQNTISQWLTGTNTPNLATLEKISKALGVPANYFFDSSTNVKGDSNVVGKNNNASSDLKKDIILLSTQIELLSAKITALESKIENLELKYNLLKKGK